MPAGWRPLWKLYIWLKSTASASLTLLLPLLLLLHFHFSLTSSFLLVSYLFLFPHLSPLCHLIALSFVLLYTCVHKDEHRLMEWNEPSSPTLMFQCRQEERASPFAKEFCHLALYSVVLLLLLSRLLFRSGFFAMNRNSDTCSRL